MYVQNIMYRDTLIFIIKFCANMHNLNFINRALSRIQLCTGAIVISITLVI